MGRFDDEAFDTLFLDRDGVINRLRPDDYVKNWEEFEFMPGMLDRLARWSGRFRRILVVTNQRGVGKGIMSLDDLNRIHDRMIEEIERHGGRIDRVYFCTALSPDDPNRKPQTGMAQQARIDFPDIDFARSLMIGDSESDRQFARNAGMAFLPAEEIDCLGQLPTHSAFLAATGPETAEAESRSERPEAWGPDPARAMQGLTGTQPGAEPRKRNATASAGLRKPPEDRCRAPP